MFKFGDTAYFRFCGDWATKCYRGHYCLPPEYYAFMPLKIFDYKMGRDTIKGMMCVVGLAITGSTWNLSVDCIEKEFSIEKFVLAQVEWGKKLTPTQAKFIFSTIGLPIRE